MADDKIVTKKTAAKKPSAKKAVSKTAAAKVEETTAVSTKPAATPTKAAANKTPTTKKTASKKTATKKGVAKKAAPAPSRASTPATPDDRQISLKQIANVSPDKRLAMVQEAAYYRAEKRQFAPGHEEEDWAAAEREIDELISRAKGMTGA